MTRKYRVYDTTGALIWTFNSYKSAREFCMASGRYDWIIR